MDVRRRAKVVVGEDDVIAAGAAGRPRSLRREWTWAFGVVTLSLLVAGAGILAGVDHLVNEFAGTVPKFHRPFGRAPRCFPELMGSFSD